MSENPKNIKEFARIINADGVEIGLVNTDQQVVTLKSAVGVEQFGFNTQVLRQDTVTDGLSKTLLGARTISVVYGDNGSTLDVLKLDSNKRLKVNSESHEEDIALGNVTGEETLRKFGYNDAVGSSYEVIAGFTPDYTISSAQPMEIVYTGNDAEGGTGARTVIIQGVDGSGDMLEETITLTAAASPKALVNSFMWINRAYVVEVGSLQDNENDITIRTTGAATPATTTYGIIEADEGQTLQSLFYVPNDFTDGLIIKRWDIASGSGKAGTSRLRTKKNALIGTEESWRTRDKLRFYQNHVDRDFKESPMVVTPNSLVMVEGKTDAGSGELAANFWGHLQ